MGSIVVLSLIGAIPASGVAAFLWARSSRAADAVERDRLMTRAAGLTAVTMALQALSLLATLLVAAGG